MRYANFATTNFASYLAEVCSCKLGVGAELLLNSEKLVVLGQALRPVFVSILGNMPIFYGKVDQEMKNMVELGSPVARFFRVNQHFIEKLDQGMIILDCF